MKLDKKTLLLYGVTDRRWLAPGEQLSSAVEAALKGGITFLQLREKELDDEAVLEEARELKKLCQRYGVPFVVNDKVQLALDVDADGVHVGQKDMKVEEARSVLGSDKLIGVSVQTVEQALQAQKEGADYLGVGSVFPTSSKGDAAAVSLETLRDICSAADLPVVAIGGIQADNAELLKDSGICGAAVISAVFGQPDIQFAAAELKRILWDKVVQP